MITLSRSHFTSAKSNVLDACVVAPRSRFPSSNRKLCTCASLGTSVASEAQLTYSQRRELENESRRHAYEAQREEQLTAEKSGLQWWEVDCPANMVNVQSLAELQELVNTNTSAGKLCVVNFFAPECYACKSLQPKLRQIARDNPDALFLKVNGLVGDLMAYCEDMAITKIPYFHFYKTVNGQPKRVAEFSANMRPDKLALLRAEIAAHKQVPIAAADTVQYQALEA